MDRGVLSTHRLGAPAPLRLCMNNLHKRRDWQIAGGRGLNGLREVMQCARNSLCADWRAGADARRGTPREPCASHLPIVRSSALNMHTDIC